MHPNQAHLGVITCLAVTVGLFVGAELSAARPRKMLKRPQPVGSDRYGDPLPLGALARLGTVRFRHPVPLFVLSPDGKTLAFGYDPVHLCRVADGKEWHQIHGEHESSLWPTSFSPQGTLLSTWDRGTIRLWDVKTGKQLWRLQEQGKPEYSASTFTADGKYFVSWGAGPVVRLWQARTGKLLRQHRLSARSPVDVSSDGKVLAGPVDEHTLRLWDVASGRVLRTLPHRKNSLPQVSFLPSRQTLALIDADDRTLPLYEVATGKERRLPLGAPLREFALKYSGNGRVLAAQHYKSERISCWDVTTGKRFPEPRMDPSFREFALSPDGKTLAGVGSRSVSFWSIDTGQQLRGVAGRVRFHTESGVQVDFTPDSKTLLTCCTGAVRFWEVATGKELPGPQGHTEEVQCLAFSADGTALATAGCDGKIFLWEAATGKVLGHLASEQDCVGELSLSPAGKTLAACGFNIEGGFVGDFKLALWDLGTGRRRWRFEQDPVGKGIGMGDHGVAFQFAPDGKTLAVTSRMSSTIDLRDVATGKKRKVLRMKWVGALAFSPAGGHLAVSGSLPWNNRKNAIMLWDCTTGAARFTLPEDGDQIAFSVDGKMLAALDHNEVRVWELATREQAHTFCRPAEELVALAFTPSGRLLILASYDEKKQVDLWDGLAGKKLHCFQASGGRFSALALSPDGKLLATALPDTTVLTWDLRRLGAPKRSRPVHPDAPRLQRLWDDLAEGNAARGYQAVQELSRVPAEAVPWLRQRLQPVPPPDRRRLARWIGELDHVRFATRQKALAGLEGLGDVAGPALRRTLAGGPSLEVRRRLEVLLRKLEDPVMSPEVRRAVRATQVLEQIGNSQARQVLRVLARGTPGGRLTREAKASLQRLARRAVVKP